MKKIISILSACIALAVSIDSYAQDNSFDLGSQRINVGIGAPNISVGGMKIPPVSVSYEKGVFCTGSTIIGLGILGEYSETKETYDTRKTIDIEAFGKVHFPIGESFEVSGYLGLGYGSYGYVEAKISEFSRSIGVEGYYRLTSNLGLFVNLEANSLPGKAEARIGISFNL